jgi:regulator of telomere elongation helicase 1
MHHTHALHPAPPRQSRDVSVFIEGIIDALRGPLTCHLLAGFAAFLPSKDRNWYCNTVAEHFRAAGTAGGGGGGGSQAGASRGGAAGGSQQQRRQGEPAAGKRPAAAGGAAAAVATRPEAVAKRPRMMPGSVAGPVATAGGLGAGRTGGARPPLQQQQQQLQQPKPLDPKQSFLSKIATSGAAPPSASGANWAARLPKAGGGPAGAGAGAGSQGQQQKQPNQQGLGRPTAAAGGSRSDAAGPGAGGAAGRGTGKGSGGGGSSAAAGGQGPRPCGVCSKAPMESAHRAPCGHLACYSCWLKLLCVGMRAAKCPVCSKELRRAQLTAQPFA